MAIEKTTIEELAAEARREYYRKWRREHPDSVRRSNKRYWEKKAEQKREEAKQNDR